MLPPAQNLDAASTLAEALACLTRDFREAGLDTPGLDARRLLSWACGIDTTTLLREPERPVAGQARRRLTDAARRRCAHEPVSRIVGRRAFHGLDLEVGPATLDPRPDTETLVAGVLALRDSQCLPGLPAPRILDIGTGTGAILLALLASLPHATGIGLDLDPDALAIAARNAETHGLAARARFIRSRWLDGVTDRFDVVVSNPPYIPSADIETLAPEVRDYDPRLALDGGPDGLDAYRALIPGLAKIVASPGLIALEVGAGQDRAVAELFRSTFADRLEMTATWNDLSGIGRCVAIRAR